MATYIRRPGQNGKAVWQARVRRHGHPQQTRTFDRKAEAQTWASEVEASMRAGRFLDQRPSLHITLSELLRRYLSEITPKKRGKAAETSHGRSILADPVSALSLQSCTTQKMSEFRDRRLNSVRPATVNRELNLFSHVFTVASADWSMPLPYGQPRRLPAATTSRTGGQAGQATAGG